MGRQQAWRDATLTLTFGTALSFMQDYWALTAVLAVTALLCLGPSARATDRVNAFVSEALQANRRGVFLP